MGKARLYAILEGGTDDPLARAFGIGLTFLILVNVAAVVLVSVPQYERRFGGPFEVMEWIVLAIFTVEYVLRLYACTADPKYAHPVKGRLRWMATPGAIIDLLAFLPFYFPGVRSDLAAFRILRMFRIVRILKLVRYWQAAEDFLLVFRRRGAELLLTLFGGLVVILLISSIMHVVEGRAQPEAFGSIPNAMWWGVVTMTTVGYGDVVPVTSWGRALAGVLALVGVGLIALPASILAGSFADTFRERREARRRRKCPHCGEEIEERTSGDDL
jgi:voltage-gated potassium channel